MHAADTCDCFEQSGQGVSSNKEYMQVLKEICEKDPLNVGYATKYIAMLV